MTLNGKRVLVTAGGDGIGLEIARAFAGAGSKVLVCDIQSESLARLAKDFPGIHNCLADVSREKDVAAMFALVDQKLGGLDVLINNAGIAGPTGGIETLSLADWERTLAVNLTGQFLCIRQAVPRLRQGRDPAIINLASAAGHLGMPGRAPYSASKWGVVGLTKTLAIELGRDGIRVNAILPRPKRWENPKKNSHGSIPIRPRLDAWSRPAISPTWCCLRPAIWLAT